MQTFLGILYTGMGAGQALTDLSNITKAKNVPRRARPHGSKISSEECPCHCWRTQRGPRQMYGHATSLQRHTLGDAVQSVFRDTHTGWRLNRCRRAVRPEEPWPKPVNGS